MPDLSNVRFSDEDVAAMVADLKSAGAVPVVKDYADASVAVLQLTTLVTIAFVTLAASVGIHPDEWKEFWVHLAQTTEKVVDKVFSTEAGAAKIDKTSEPSTPASGS